MMVRLTMAAALLSATAGAVMAQQTMDEALRDVRVFDCALGDSQAIYIFRADADGAVSLVGDDDTQVRATESGLSIMTDEGLQEISDGAYHVYRAGSAESGTCTDVTDFAITLYGPLTAAYAPEATGKTVAEQAAAASLADLTVRTQRAESEMTVAKDELAEAVSARLSVEAELLEAKTELELLRPKVEMQSNALAAASNQVEDLTGEVTVLTSQLEESEALRDLALAEAKELSGELTALQQKFAELEAFAKATATERDGLSSELAELRALHETVAAAAAKFQGQLTETTTKLEDTEASRRSLVATVAGLNGKISELGTDIRAVRAERDAALKKASGADSSRVATSSLTNAAIRKLATVQGRSQNAVRSELCSLIGRGSGC